MSSSAEKQSSWLDRPLPLLNKAITTEILLFGAILALALVSRFYGLGERALSHDESVHVYYSYLFSEGQGYFHNPLSHGPLQFHLIALLFFFLGSSDFLGRLPHAIASILTILMLWNWRHYLGRAGTIVAALLMLISPFMLYYGRYARNESFVALFGVLTLYAILRYLETGRNRYLYLLTVAAVLHFTVKETAFIYTAQALVFLAVYFIFRLTNLPWKRDRLYNWFLAALAVGVLLACAAAGLALYSRGMPTLDAAQTANPLIPGQTLEAGGNAIPVSADVLSTAILVTGISGGVALLTAIGLLIAGYGWQNLRRERAFDMLILLGTFVLPQLAAFPARWLGWNPLEYQITWPGWDLAAIFSQAPAKTAAVFIILALMSIAIGMTWDGKRWLWHAALFWGVYALFYTSLFTNPAGFFTGTVGSLGYWLEQQGVHRGSQPWYYYLLVQVPVYEFLPALGLIPAIFFELRRKSPHPVEPVTDPSTGSPFGDFAGQRPKPAGEKAPVFALLLWWTLSSLFAYTVAGEKMPWLTVHIALPMILLTAWGLGQAIERTDWHEVRQRGGVWVGLLLAIFVAALIGMLVSLLGLNPPFQGKTEAQLLATGQFLFWLVTALASGGGLFYLARGWDWKNVARLTILVIFGYLSILTGRTALRAAYVNAGHATEYLVYAHGADGIKDLLKQIEVISQRTSGGYNELAIAYDAGGETQGVSWPWKWYMRNFPNASPYYSVDETLLDADVIVADPQSYEEVSALTGNNYYQFDTLRMVWPNQDYFGLTWARVNEMLTDRRLRAAIFQIWYNRDYSLYAEVMGKSGFDLYEWNPSDSMRMYVRKDVAEKVWEYNLLQQFTLQQDPYEQGSIQLTADYIFGMPGTGNGSFNAPHGIAVAPDGSLYVVDTNNNRIQHFSAEGEFLDAWGTFADITIGEAPLGTFNLPWALAVSPNGQWVYVTDTWNHRIQKFTAEGEAVAAWGYGSYHVTLGDPFGLWGPRGVAVDNEGRIYVADTGNKRIVVYDADGNYLAQFGGAGMQPGQLDEPVGIAVDEQGFVYVADTWNRRIQVFAPGTDDLTWIPTLQWDVAGWYGESLENKPLLAVDDFGHIFVADPELARVLEFTTSGAFIRAWGEAGYGSGKFGLVSGLAVDDQGRVWVSDAQNNLLSRFALP
jgi:predicted membrane-bound mannosyltransferase/DNA-binding beta-propeller fold protein YncE